MALTKKVQKSPVVTHFSLVFFVFTVAKLGSGEEISGYFKGAGDGAEGAEKETEKAFFLN